MWCLYEGRRGGREGACGIRCHPMLFLLGVELYLDQSSFMVFLIENVSYFLSVQNVHICPFSFLFSSALLVKVAHHSHVFHFLFFLRVSHRRVPTGATVFRPTHDMNLEQNACLARVSAFLSPNPKFKVFSPGTKSPNRNKRLPRTSEHKLQLKWTRS